MNIHWKLKSPAFRFLSLVPRGTLYFVQRYITRRSKVNITSIPAEWEFHADMVRETNSKTLVEFGAGKSLAQNIYLSSFLESQVVIDLFPMMEFSINIPPIFRPLQIISLGHLICTFSPIFSSASTIPRDTAFDSLN